MLFLLKYMYFNSFSADAAMSLIRIILKVCYLCTWSVDTIVHTTIKEVLTRTTSVGVF